MQSAAGTGREGGERREREVEGGGEGERGAPQEGAGDKHLGGSERSWDEKRDPGGPGPKIT